MSGMDEWQERENQRMREHVPGQDTASRLWRENEQLRSALTDTLRELTACAKQLNARPDGSVAAAQKAARTALSLEDDLYFCPGGYYIGSFVCRSCNCPKGAAMSLDDKGTAT